MGIDLKLADGKIEVSMEEYANAIQEIPLRTNKKKDKLNDIDMKVLRKTTGKIAWLATNCRPDLCFNALKLSMKGKEANIEDLKYANHAIKKAKSKTSKVSYRIGSGFGNIVVYGLGDASYKAGEKAVGGQFILLGTREGRSVLPIFWRTKLIKKVCKSPKDSETVNMGILADLARHIANQMEQIIDAKVEVKLVTDSLGNLESIASTHHGERCMMRADVADLKQKLEIGEV